MVTRPETGSIPDAPGSYQFLDAQGRVLYVGKAKNLRNRAAHYFLKAAADDPRTSDLVKLIADIDFLPAETEVDALLRWSGKHHEPPSTVLELAAGPAEHARDLARRGLQATALDLNPAMCAQATRWR